MTISDELQPCTILQDTVFLTSDTGVPTVYFRTQDTVPPITKCFPRLNWHNEEYSRPGYDVTQYADLPELTGMSRNVISQLTNISDKLCFYDKQVRQSTYYVTLRFVNEIIVAVGTQLSTTYFCGCGGVYLRACSLTKPACKKPPYCYLQRLWLHDIFRHYLITDTIFGKKSYWT